MLSLEEKLKIAKQNAATNVTEEDVIESDRKVQELQKKIDDLQFTASNLDAALETERERRRELENEKQSLMKLKSANISDPEMGASSSFSLLIDDDGGDRAGFNYAKRFINKQKHYLLRGPPNARIKRVVIVLYLFIIHVFLIKMCLL